MKEITITKVNHGQRADKFLRKYLSDAPLSFIYKLFRIKDIKVNGKRINKEYILQENDLMQIYVTDKQLEEFNKPRLVVKTNIDLDIIYEDDNIIIINKPSGILVHGDINEKRITLTNIVLNYLKEKDEFNENNTFVPSPCHRLDRNTSGLIVFAKNIEALHILEELFKTKENIKKKYITLVDGLLYGSNKIDAPLYKDEEKNMVYVRNIKNGGKNALTLYEVKETFDNCTLLNVDLITGRTHQIRVHMAHIGHPIIGDGKYGNININRKFEGKYHYHHQFLHAETLTFINVTGILSYLSDQSFIAPLPEKENKILKIIRENKKL